MDCGFCANPGQFTCSRCHMVRYCSKEHQKKHWKEHKTSCKCYRVEENEVYGRFLTAQPGLPGQSPPPVIKAGQRILQSSPVLVGPRLECPSPVCLSCLKALVSDGRGRRAGLGGLTQAMKTKEESVNCKSCQFAFCSQECIQQPSHATKECKIIAQLTRLCRRATSDVGPPPSPRSRPCVGSLVGSGGESPQEEEQEEEEEKEEDDEDDEDDDDDDDDDGNGNGGNSTFQADCRSLGYEAILPLRLLMAWDEKKFLTLLKLESHVTALENQTTRWNAIRTKVIEVLRQQWEESLVEQACGLILTNTFEVMISPQEAPLLGIYEEPSLMNHDCVGNTRLVMSSDLKLTVYASIDIKAGMPILFNYVRPLDSIVARQKYLNRNKFFQCTCARCHDPTDLTTFVSSLRCPSCNGPVVAQDLHSLAGDWSCLKCQVMMKPKQVMGSLQRLEEIQNKVETANSEKALNQYLKETKMVAFDTHGLVCDILQKLIRIMSPQATHGPHVEAVLGQKVQYCAIVLRVLDKLEPGLSLGRGIVLYEMQSTLVQIANVEFEKDQTRVTELMASLVKAKEMLVTADQCLALEPPQSPIRLQFGHIQGDVQELDNYIEMVKYL
ncbi:uncharacterized protein LOC131891555 isoform X2 [Tigriopus californicus]|uniref:uncharacterized protein LOC131891555 isoform X2 n=1 Tax=Tigriopus californicus TaxID=6832 RepID=UPI0027DA7E11|nr:uncharacterized protein LOC131891555 isoform X2 [Tigriopus californicus]